MRIVRLAGLATTAGCGTILYLLNDSVKARALIEIPSYPWRFQRAFQAFDHATLRRGWQIYRTVCHTCHSLRYVRFMDLIDTTHTEEEVKQIAAEFEVEDGPDDDGNYYMRPGKFSDMVPKPFPNEQAARAANLGSYPPDLTYTVYSKLNGINFLFSYLTGWQDPPAGVKLNDGQHFNPYFPGCITGMAPILYDDMMEFEDGTPATVSQMAKDLVEFLTWTASPEHDTRQLMMLKGLIVFSLIAIATYDLYRRHISHLKSRRIAYVPKRSC